MTQTFAVTTTPTNLQTELNLTADAVYSVQVTGTTPVYYAEAAAAPATTQHVHSLAPGAWKTVQIDADNPPWVWTGQTNSRLAVTLAV